MKDDIDLTIDDCSGSLDDEYSFVVNAVLLANLPETIIISGSVFQQRIADVPC